MHEYGVTQNIVNIVVKEADNNNANKINSITLVVGELSSIIGDSVQMYFDILSKDTPSEGAKLIFKRVKAQFECRQCNNLFERQNTDFECPKCGGLGKPTGIGKEFYIESIEVE